MSPIAILGPTASGKSSIAMHVAEALGAEIVSCDSMQVYRGLDIGTAKPSAARSASEWKSGLILRAIPAHRHDASCRPVYPHLAISSARGRRHAATRGAG